MKQISPAKLFIIGIVISSLLSFPFILDPTLSPRFMALGICLTLALYHLHQSKSSFNLKADLIFLSYTAYTFFCCLSVLWANTRSEAIFESSKQVLNLFVFAMTYYALKTGASSFLNSVLKLSVILFAVSLSVAIYQFITLETLNKETLYMIKGLQGHKNLFSSFLFLDLFFLIIASYKLEKTWKIWAVISIFICLGLLAFLRTKAVWTGLLLASVLFVLLYFFSKRVSHSNPKINLAILLGAGLLVLNIFFLNFLQPIIQKSIHYTSQSDSTGKVLPGIKLEEERLVLWDKTYHLIKHKPLIGTGMGNWQIYLPDATLSGLWRGEDLNYTFQRPHNDFLWILSETGLIGFNLFLLFLFSVLLFLVRSLRVVSQNKIQTFDILLCVAFIAGYYCVSFFDFPRERIEHGIWINLILGIAYYQVKTHLHINSYFSLRIGGTQFALAAGLLALISFIGLLRLNGEFFMRRMLIYKSNNQLENVISAGNSAQTFAYKLDATSVPISWYTGNAEASLGKYAEAQKDFISAAKLTPYNRNVLNDLGSSYVYTNNVLLAKFYYEEAARISPRFDEPKLNLAAIYINAKDFKTASYWLKSLMHDSERRKNYEQIVELTQQP